MDVIFSSEIEDLESPVRTVLEATSWIEWRIYAAISLAVLNTSEKVKLKCLFLTAART